VLEELRARGLRHGKDVGLVCFDDAPWAEVVDPPIPIISQPAYEIGASAAELLVKRINGTLDGPVRRIVFDTDLIVPAGSSAGRGDATTVRRRTFRTTIADRSA
jgi:LacI family transcriptional regulator